MKKNLLLLSCLYTISLTAQIQIGNYDSTFYHAEFSPSYKIMDTVYSNGVIDNISHSATFDLDNDNNIDLSINSKHNGVPLPSGGSYPYWESSISIINDSLEIISLPDNIVDTLTSNDSISENNYWISDTQFKLAYSINNFTTNRI